MINVLINWYIQPTEVLPSCGEISAAMAVRDGKNILYFPILRRGEIERGRDNPESLTDIGCSGKWPYPKLSDPRVRHVWVECMVD